MNTNHLFYKILKRTITAGDYIDWSYSVLEDGFSSPSLAILSSCSSTDNIFEIESYFRRAAEELEIEHPTFETAARARMEFLAMKIMETKDDDYRQIYHLTDRIFKVAAVELNYPEELMNWVEMSELMDRVDYNYDKYVISEIKNEAGQLLGTDT